MSVKTILAFLDGNGMRRREQGSQRFLVFDQKLRLQLRLVRHALSSKCLDGIPLALPGAAHMFE
jgi:hypothetical protein